MDEIEEIEKVKEERELETVKESFDVIDTLENFDERCVKILELVDDLRLLEST